MSGAARGCPLLAQLLQMLPDSRLVKCERHEWHSATFSGERVLVTLQQGTAQRIEDFARSLPDADFALPGRFVADIRVSQIAESDNAVELTLEALLLDE